MTLAAFMGTLRRLIAAPSAEPPVPRRLAHCPACGGDTVNPIGWYEHYEAHWWLRLRCARCAVVRELIASDHEAERLERDMRARIDRRPRRGGAVRCSSPRHATPPRPP